MPTLSALTIYIFGFTSLLAGAYNLINSDKALSTLALPSSARPPFDGAALGAIAMGLYYPLAAAQENRKFFILTVPMRLLTAMVFWNHGGVWTTPALWEGFGAALTGAALVLDGCRRK
jgi:hypothetical protein